MAFSLSEPTIIERSPCNVVGVYALFEGEEEGPAWNIATRELNRRLDEIKNREGDTILGFLYRPHKDYPSVPEQVRACFMGVEVTDVTQIPDGMATTSFTGGKYAVVECSGDTELRSAMGVGGAVESLERWAPEHGYREGDACFTYSHEKSETPPFINYVLIKLEEQR